MTMAKERRGVQELRDALASLRVSTAGDVETSSGRTADLVLELVGGGRVPLETKVLALADAATMTGRLDQWTSVLDDGAIGVVVADRVTAAAREVLNLAGWGWLDLRGHLRIVGPGIVIDTDVASAGAPEPARDAFSGEVGRELAVHLLLDPEAKVGVRSAAAELSRAPSSVSASLGALQQAGLVTAERMPVLPDLFWAIAEHWQTPSVDVATLPGAANAGVLHLGLSDVGSTAGWALSDTVAATAYGAPVASRADHPPDFLVPDANTLRRAVQLLGPAPSSATRAARLRIAPLLAVCTRRVDGRPWPLANPLFVALDLAQDPGRGREILDGWTPPESWCRVW